MNEPFLLVKPDTSPAELYRHVEYFSRAHPGDVYVSRYPFEMPRAHRPADSVVL